MGRRSSQPAWGMVGCGAALQCGVGPGGAGRDVACAVFLGGNFHRFSLFKYCCTN